LIQETISLPAAGVSLPLLYIAVDRLLQRAYARPSMQGRYSWSALLSCALDRAATWEQTCHFRTGADDWKRVAETIKRRLEREHPPAPVEAMTITLSGLSGASNIQPSLFPDLRADRERRLLEIERQLQARLNGVRALHRLVEVAPWHPAAELRTAQVSIDPDAADSMRPLSNLEAIEVKENLAQELLAVRHGQRWRRIVRIDDRWSFDLWWQPTPMVCSYYRVSQDDGQQLTLFHDEQAARWYRQPA